MRNMFTPCNQGICPANERAQFDATSSKYLSRRAGFNFSPYPVIILSLIFSTHVQCQDVTNHDELIITTDALLHVDGSFRNDSTVQNDGTIEVTNDFTNTAGHIFQVGSDNTSQNRVVKFVGSGKQLIKGGMSTAGTASFYNLLIDQVDPSDTVEMRAAVVVEGSIIFGTENTTATYNPDAYYTDNSQLGILKTFKDPKTEFLLDLQNDDPGAITGYPSLVISGAPATGFILTSGARGSSNGGLQRKISTAESYVYPIGTIDKGFNGVALNFSTVPGGGSVKAKFCDNTSSPTGYVGKISRYCHGCDSPTYPVPDNNGYNRYFADNVCNSDIPQWIILEDAIKNHGYWSFASTNTGYTYYIEAFPNSFTAEGTGADTWRVIKHEAAYGVDPSDSSVDWRPEIESTLSDTMDILYYTLNGNCYAGSGVPGGLYTDFSHFTMKEASNDNALPVGIVYVKAEPVQNQFIKVSWATATESNNRGFEVMRSSDGVSYSDLGWVDGHNNSTVSQSYLFDDHAAVPGSTYYYKVRQVDNNGKSVFTNIVSAGLSGKYGIRIYPNPTDKDLFLVIGNSQEAVAVTLYDITGRKVYDHTYTINNNGENGTVSIPVSSMFSSGAYTLSAVSNGAEYREKVILR